MMMKTLLREFDVGDPLAMAALFYCYSKGLGVKTSIRTKLMKPFIALLAQLNFVRWLR
jgi:hypothetical protein